MRKLLFICAPLLLAITAAAQVSTHVQPGYCTSSGPLSHCGFVDENGVHGLVNANYVGTYIDFGGTEYALAPLNADYADLTLGDPYPVIAVQANSNGAGQTVTVILHGYKTTRRSGRLTIHSAYITSGTVTVN